MEIVFVDDQSDDGTAELVWQIGQDLDSLGRLQVLAVPLPDGWTGELWAMEQGVGANPAASAPVAPEHPNIL